MLCNNLYKWSLNHHGQLFEHVVTIKDTSMKCSVAKCQKKKKKKTNPLYSDILRQ